MKWDRFVVLVFGVAPLRGVGAIAFQAAVRAGANPVWGCEHGLRVRTLGYLGDLILFVRMMRGTRSVAMFAA